MLGSLSYLGYTLLFCLPPILLLWLRRDFRTTLLRDARRILLTSALLAFYGSTIWPIALDWGAWAYAPDKITGVLLFRYVHLEDAVWWLLVSFLIASFVSVASAPEERGGDLVRKSASRIFSRAAQRSRPAP